MDAGDRQAVPQQRNGGRLVRSPHNGSQSGLYVSRAAGAGASANAAHPVASAPTGSPSGPGTNTPGTWTRRPYRSAESRVRELHELAGTGRLAAVAAAAEGDERVALTGAAWDVAWPIVFQRITRRVELTRGHPGCASGVDRLADDCLDRFHDDVEAVVADVLAHARTPIRDLEAWIASRLNAATVDGNRRRRGERGALQRPRLPAWLSGQLGHDRWLLSLATQMLVWVGVPSTAGSEVWPLEAWAQRRAAETGDWMGSDPGTVGREVDTVLSAMRTRPDWYESYVERPLGRKQAPVAVRGEGDVSPLALDDPDARMDAEMRRLAAAAVDAIGERHGRGEGTRAIVVEVIRKVFSDAPRPTLERAPHAVADPIGGVTGALGDPETLRRIVDTVRTIIKDTDR